MCLFDFYIIYICYHNRKLPQTLKDGEDFARNQRWYYFVCFDKTISKKDGDVSNESH